MGMRESPYELDHLLRISLTTRYSSANAEQTASLSQPPRVLPVSYHAAPTVEQLRYRCGRGPWASSTLHVDVFPGCGKSWAKNCGLFCKSYSVVITVFEANSGTSCDFCRATQWRIRQLGAVGISLHSTRLGVTLHGFWRCRIRMVKSLLGHVLYPLISENVPSRYPLCFLLCKLIIFECYLISSIMLLQR